MEDPGQERQTAGMEAKPMKMQDCDKCLSAGSVNKWGVCEICGEDLGEVTTFAQLRQVSSSSMLQQGESNTLEAGVAVSVVKDTGQGLSSVGQDAA